MIEGVLLFCGILLILFLIISTFIIIDSDEDNYSGGLISQIEKSNYYKYQYDRFTMNDLTEFCNDLISKKRRTGNQRVMSMTSDYYDSLRDYETYRHYQVHNPYLIGSSDNTYVGLGTPNPDYNLEINNNTTTNMNSDQKQVESAVKYLSDKREKASEVVEINIKEYNKLIQENADLKAKAKAGQEVIRIEESEYDEEVITYAGKDKVITELNGKIKDSKNEIRDLQQQLEMANEAIEERRKESNKEIDKEKKRLQDYYEQKFEKDNKKLIQAHREEKKELENIIDQLNNNIQEANDRNKILSDMNKRYISTLNKIMGYLSSKGIKFFRRKFGLESLRIADNYYRVSNKSYNRDMYVNTTTGESYWA